MTGGHDWTVFQTTTHSATGDTLNLEACSDCPATRLLIDFAETRNRTSVVAALSRIVRAIDQPASVEGGEAIAFIGDAGAVTFEALDFKPILDADAWPEIERAIHFAPLPPESTQP